MTRREMSCACDGTVPRLRKQMSDMVGAGLRPASRT